MRCLRAVLAVLAVAMTALTATAAVPATASAGKKARSACANRLCTKLDPGTKSCWKRDGRTRIARCFIRRAALHFHQPRKLAYYVAWRESRYHWGITNPSSGTAGLFQFARQTWRYTPYRNRSPYHPRWASLGAMWMWAHGYRSHWAV
jgi:hypothetical protein